MLRSFVLVLLLVDINFSCVQRSACDEDEESQRCVEMAETGGAETETETGEVMDLGG